MERLLLDVLSFAFLGFAGTFSSGSKGAWIADLIKKKNKNLMHNYFSKVTILNRFALTISGFLGAFLVRHFGISIIWFVAFLAYMTAIPLLLFAKEYFIARKVKITRSLNELKVQTKESIKYSYSHNVLFYFIIAGFITTFALNFQTNISWIPLLKELGIKDYQFGYLWSIISAVRMVSPMFAMKFLKKGKERNFILFGIITGSIITLFVFFAQSLFFAVLIMLLTTFFFENKRPTERVYFHRFIPNKLRATIGSVESIVLSIASIISLPIAGFFIDRIGPRYTILISAILMIPAIIYFNIKEVKTLI